MAAARAVCRRTLLSPRKKILVAIFQRGAADGLNVVVPHGEKAYYACGRPSPFRGPPAGNADAAIDLDGFFGLHPSLAPLKPLFDAAASRDRGCGGLARSDALALRRAGLHGVGHARAARRPTTAG